MKNNINKLALKAGSWYILSNFLIKVVAVISIPIFTRLLSPTDFGITNTYTSWVGILTIIGTLDIYSCVQIARYNINENDMDSFISSILTVSSISLLFLYIIFKLLGEYGYTLIGLPPALVDFMFIEILFTNAFTIMQTKHKAYFKYKEFVYLSLLIAILSPTLAIIFISIAESQLSYARIIGYSLPKIIISFFIYIHILKKGRKFFDKKFWGFALSISIPLIPHHLSGIILSHFDRIMINNMIGPAMTGIYSMAYSYAALLSFVWSSFNQAWVPWFYSKMKEDSIEDIRKFSKPYLMIYVMIYFVLLTFGPEAIKLFGPKEYWSGIWVVPPVLLGIFFKFIYSLYVNIEFYLKKTNYIAIGTIISALVNIVLNYIFIPIYGYIAAAYTTLVAYLIMLVMHYFISKRWEKRDLYEEGFIIKVIIISLVLTTLINYFYDVIVLRYLIMTCVLLISIVKNYKQIIKLYNNIRR